MAKPKLIETLRYKFDNLMAKGTAALLLTLAGITTFLIILISLVVLITKSAPGKSYLELLWMGLMRSIDSGTISGDTGNGMFILLMFITTLCGIFILSILISILTAGIEAKLDTLRKGRSKVIEENQTIILGWSEQIFTILSELIEANSSQKNACVIILGNEDKTEMDDAIRERIKDCKTTRIVTRQGNPIDIDDLALVSLNTSKSIIIIPEDDISVIKTILAITNNPNKRMEPYNIVTVLKDPMNIQIAEIAGDNQAEFILSDMIISRIIAQTCRQPGLSTIYTELLDFDGDEIYFSDCAETIGRAFSETLTLFESSTIIGIHSDGISYLNPPMTTVLKEGDQLIAISEDDDTITVNNSLQIALDTSVISTNTIKTNQLIEKTLLLGWNKNASAIIMEMDQYVNEGSLVTVVTDNIAEEDFKKGLAGVRNQAIELLQANPKDRSILDSLIVKNYNHVIILCNDSLSIQESDANTLIILLQLRDISEKSDLHFSVVSEMLDVRNKKLAEATKVNDFIVSEKLVSLMLTQVSENPKINSVFKDLFDSDGSEIYIKKASDYIQPNKPVNFYTLVEATRIRDEVLLGYLLADEQGDAMNNFGIYLNPKKSNIITLTENDSLIVISEN